MWGKGTPAQKKARVDPSDSQEPSGSQEPVLERERGDSEREANPSDDSAEERRDEEPTDEEPEEEGTEVGTDHKSEKAASGSATYKSKFKREWTSSWPFITQGATSSHFFCSVCRKDVSCSHQGVRDVKRHITASTHLEKEQALKSANKISKYLPSPAPAGMSVQVTKVGHLKKKAFSTCRYSEPFPQL